MTRSYDLGAAHPDVVRVIDLLELDLGRHQNTDGPRPIGWRYRRTVVSEAGIVAHEFYHSCHPIAGEWRLWIEAALPTTRKELPNGIARTYPDRPSRS